MLTALFLEPNTIQFLPLRVSFTYNGSPTSQLASSLLDVSVFVHGHQGEERCNTVLGSVSMKEVLRVICKSSPEIIPSVQINDTSVYIRRIMYSGKQVNQSQRDIKCSVTGTCHNPDRLACQPSSDATLPLLTSSTSSLDRSIFIGQPSENNIQGRTGYAMPAIGSRPPSSFQNGEYSARSVPPFIHVKPDEASAGFPRSRGAAWRQSEMPIWTGKGTLSSILSEPGHGKTLAKCSVIQSKEFSRGSPQSEGGSATSRRRRKIECRAPEDDGLAALVLEERLNDKKELSDTAYEFDQARSWGVFVEVELRTLGRPITLEATSKLRNTVFGLNPRSFVRAVIIPENIDVAKLKRLQRGKSESGKFRSRADRIESSGSLARKDLSQMVRLDDHLESSMHDLKLVGLRSDPLARPYTNSPRYPASIDTSSVLKRKTLAIPHHQIPAGRRGPSSAPKHKRRKVTKEDPITRGSISHKETQVKPESDLGDYFEETRVESQTVERHDKENCKELGRNTIASRFSFVGDRGLGYPLNEKTFLSARSFKRTLSEIAERESHKHALKRSNLQLFHSGTSKSCIVNDPGALAQKELDYANGVTKLGQHLTPPETLALKSIFKKELDCPNHVKPLPLSDDTSLSAQRTDHTITFARPDLWLQGSELSDVFSLDDQLSTQAKCEAEVFTKPNRRFGSQDMLDANPAALLSPFDFSQLPPSSPPVTWGTSQHSILLLSSPEFSQASGSPMYS